MEKGDKAAAASTEAAAVALAVQEKCIRLSAQIAVRTVKSHLNQSKANQFIAGTATRITRSFSS